MNRFYSEYQRQKKEKTKGGCGMKSFFKFLGACSFGFSAVSLFWLAVEIDNAELQAGKSPHSGFCPESPSPIKAFDGFSKPSRSTRIVESNNQ